MKRSLDPLTTCWLGFIPTRKGDGAWSVRQLWEDSRARARSSFNRVILRCAFTIREKSHPIRQNRVKGNRGIYSHLTTQQSVISSQKTMMDISMAKYDIINQFYWLRRKYTKIDKKERWLILQKSDIDYQCSYNKNSTMPKLRKKTPISEQKWSDLIHILA